ncbi:MAG TPA: efflux RND transporter periplasmic adaptor subunit [Candidatus Acidoferrales bacterium]|nr:efflux RND transporter periplasmic adaptor subunit [Candidatus Acidoferrales bacterium]
MTQAVQDQAERCVGGDPRATFQLSFAVCTLILAAFVAGCSRKPVTHAAPPPASVKTQVLQLVPIPDSSEYLATLKSRRSAAINPQVAGQVVKIYVKSGDHVSADAPLLQIDPSKQQAALGSQEAARNAQIATMQNAKVQFDRAQQLYDSGLIPKQDYDSAKSAYEAAQAQANSMDAQVKEQQVQLNYFQVTAPSDGIVGDIPVHVGDYVTTSTLLTTVDQPGNLEAYIYVPVEHAPDLHTGEPVDLLEDSGNVAARSSIFFVSPQVDTTTQSVLAKASIANPEHKFRNDEFVRARVTWRVTKGLEVPILAVSRINGQFFIFVAEQSDKGTVARQRLIQVGDVIGNDYVVRGGLQPGDHIIVAGFQFLIDGSAVKETVEPASAVPGASAN